MVVCVCVFLKISKIAYFVSSLALNLKCTSQSLRYQCQRFWKFSLKIVFVGRRLVAQRRRYVRCAIGLDWRMCWNTWRDSTALRWWTCLHSATAASVSSQCTPREPSRCTWPPAMPTSSRLLLLVIIALLLPSVLWRCWLGVRKSIRLVKIWLMRCWRGYLLEQSANSLHMVQLMPLPPHPFCFIKIQNGLSFWYRLTWVARTKGRKMVVIVVVLLLPLLPLLLNVCTVLLQCLVSSHCTPARAFKVHMTMSHVDLFQI